MIRTWHALFSIAIFASIPSFAQTTTRVSVDSSGTQGNCRSYSGSMSSDGRYTAFTSVRAGP